MKRLWMNSDLPAPGYLVIRSDGDEFNPQTDDEGGQGVIWRGTHQKLGNVAIKLPHSTIHVSYSFRM
jgi:hypothetical protein